MNTLTLKIEKAFKAINVPEQLRKNLLKSIERCTEDEQKKIVKVLVLLLQNFTEKQKETYIKIQKLQKKRSGVFEELESEHDLQAVESQLDQL
jgi:hypothetical protein